jgi:hypothetical protein
MADRRTGNEEALADGEEALNTVDENVGSAAIQLAGDDLREIDLAVSQIEVHGAQYPAHLQSMVGR